MLVHVKNLEGTWDPTVKLKFAQELEEGEIVLALPNKRKIIFNLTRTFTQREGAQWTEVELQLHLQTEEILTFLIGLAYHEGYCCGIQG